MLRGGDRLDRDEGARDKNAPAVRDVNGFALDIQVNRPMPVLEGPAESDPTGLKNARDRAQGFQ